MKRKVKVSKEDFAELNSYVLWHKLTANTDCPICGKKIKEKGYTLVQSFRNPDYKKVFHIDCYNKNKKKIWDEL